MTATAVIRFVKLVVVFVIVAASISVVITVLLGMTKPSLFVMSVKPFALNASTSVTISGLITIDAQTVIRRLVMLLIEAFKRFYRDHICDKDPNDELSQSPALGDPSASGSAENSISECPTAEPHLKHFSRLHTCIGCIFIREPYVLCCKRHEHAFISDLRICNNYMIFPDYDSMTIDKNIEILINRYRAVCLPGTMIRRSSGRYILDTYSKDILERNQRRKADERS
jgi:hypothetical protein